MLMRRVSWATSLALVLQFTAPGMAQDAQPKPEDLFQSLDKNSDGKLTADEVTAEQKRFFERAVRIGDKDSDGVLTKDEFLAASKEPAAPSQPLPMQGGPGRDGGGDPRQRFEMADRNKDGQLTLDEVPEPLRERMKPLFERLGKDSMSLEDFTRLTSRMGGPGGPGGGFDPGQMFGRMDTNSDGKVSRGEVPEPLRERFGRLFDAAGKDDLTQEEFGTQLRQLMSENRRPGPDGRPEMMGPPGGPGMGPEGGRGRGPVLFGMLDKNSDGQLTKEELASVVDKFTELDRNQDGHLQPSELFGGPPPGMMAGGPGREGRPEGGRPDGNRPENGRPPGGGGRQSVLCPDGCQQ